MIQCCVLLLEMFLSFSFDCWTAVRFLHLINLDQMADNKGGFPVNEASQAEHTRLAKRLSCK